MLATEALVTVVGPAAVGKSRLVAEAVRLVGGDVTVVGADLASASPTGVDALWDLVEASRAAAGPFLVWLDNCDAALPAVASLAGDLLAAGKARVVATCRRALGPVGEAVMRLEPLPCPATADDVHLSGSDPAVVLLLADAPSVAPTSADREAIAEICRAAGGLPGLLRHAGRLAETLGWSEAAARLASGHAPAGRSSEVGHSWRRVVDAGVDGLSALEEQVLERLGAFGTSFTLAAAENVCADDHLSTRDVVEAVVALTERSVLLVRHGPSGSRYELVGPLRVEAARRLEAREDSVAIRRRHCEWAVATAEAAGNASGERRWNDEECNFEVAIAWAVKNRAGDLALRLVRALTPSWCRTGTPSRYRGMVEAVAALAGGDEDMASALQCCAELAAADGDVAAAARFWHEAYQSYARLGDPAGMGRALTARGSIARRLARYDEAGQLLQEGLDLLSRHGGAGGLARGLVELGRLAGIRGQADTGRMMYREALERHRASGDTAGEAAVLACLADMALLDGHAEEGRRLHEEALRLRRNDGDHRGEAESLTRLAAAAWLADDLPAAGRLCEEAAAIQARVGDRRGLAKTLTTLAHVAYLKGDPSDSERLYREALALRTQLGDERGAAAAMVGMANALFLRPVPDLPTALATAVAAADIQRRIGDRRALAWTAYCLSEMSRDVADLPAAAAHAEESVALYEAVGAPARDRCLPVYALASCRLLSGDADDARRLALEALSLASSANALQRLRCVELAGRVAEAGGADRVAARLLGASAALRGVVPGARSPRAAETQRLAACRDALRRRLGATFEAHWSEGAAMILDDAYRAARVGLEDLDTTTRSSAPGSSRSMEWRLRLLGDFEAWRAGTALRLPGAVGEKLVKVVALHGPLPVDAATDMVWPDAPADAGRRRLANTMARLRKAAGDLVERNGEVIRLAPSVSVDCSEFKAAAHAALDEVVTPGGDGERKALKALSLYGGELLPGDRYEDWAAAPRVALSQLRLRLLDRLVEACLADGRAREAVEHLMVAIDAEPYDVSRHLLAARVLLDQGWRSRGRAVLRRAQAAAVPLGSRADDMADLMARAGLT